MHTWVHDTSKSSRSTTLSKPIRAILDLQYNFAMMVFVREPANARVDPFFSLLRFGINDWKSWRRSKSDMSFYGNHCWYINIEQLLLCGILMCLFYHHYCCQHHKRAGEHHAAREYSGQIQKPQPLTRTCSRHPRSTNNIGPYLLLDKHRVWQWHFHDCDTW